jgi:1,4-alpha-glucan branching enzyme
LKDFEDLDIEKVIIAGDFNDWSKDGWKMKKISETIFELRKPVKEFNDQFNWEFKFFVNDAYWAVLKPELVNKTYSDEFLDDVYGIETAQVRPDENGNTSFFLPGYLNAKKVILAGDFNHWDENFLQMAAVDDGWAVTINLEPGVYEYKFIVDGQWMTDPQNPQKVPNIHDTENSVLNIKKKVVFRLNGFENAQNVILAGSFNNWNENEMKMMKVGDQWEYQMNLSGGKHFYKFIVDGQWMIDPNNRYAEDDGQGNINSVVFVQ